MSLYFHLQTCHIYYSYLYIDKISIIYILLYDHN